MGFAESYPYVNCCLFATPSILLGVVCTIIILSVLPLQIADFWKEAQLLSSLHHPNVVSFYGIVRDGPDGSLATVTEFMVNGSLKQFLQKKDRYGDGTLVNLYF